MNGNELLWSGGSPRGGLDVSLAGEDLELTQLSLLLFPDLGGEAALAFASGLLTDDVDTIRMRQETLEELLARPALEEALGKLTRLLTELETCRLGVRDNAAALRVSRADAAVDGVKKAILQLERNLSKQGADILEETAADNRYAQLLRYVHFRRRLTGLYAEAVSLLWNAFRDDAPKSRPLRALHDWAAERYAKDRVEHTRAALEALDAEWPGVGAFAVDVCLDSRRMIVGLEVAEVRSAPYARPGMTEAAGTAEAREGITGLMAFPQTGSGVLFQEYLLSQVGYEVRGRLTKMRDALGKLPVTGAEELLGFRDALRFYAGAAAFAGKLKAKGSAVCAPGITEALTFRFRGARLPEQTCTGVLPVPNDLSLATGGSILMTGPNSSGTNCCLIMAGQLLVLGQLGCLLPAEEGEFSPRDQLLTLFASGESETGEDSRMGMEIRRIRLLRERMTRRSIFLFNEPMTSTSALEGGRICVELLADLAARGIPAMLVTHFNHIWSSLQEAFAAEGLEDRLHSLVMRTEAGPEGPRYLYRLEEAPPPPSSHARAVAARKGVTLEGMLSGLEARGLDVRPGDPGWAKLRQGIL